MLAMTNPDSTGRRISRAKRLAAMAMAGVAPVMAIAMAMVANAQQPGLGTLVIRPSVATVTIAPAGSGRRPLRLPSLTFSFEMSHECAPDYLPASLSLAVADSRRSLGRAALAEANGRATLAMEVPASQLPPLIISDFCAADEAANGPELGERVWTGALSALASLRCESETESQTTYAVSPLDISVVCEVPAPEAE